MYYKKEASLSVANRIKDDILEKINLLKDFKDLGTIDEYLRHMNLGHRKITAGNYKIVYRSEKSTIYITDIFDTQQDPEKQKK